MLILTRKIGEKIYIDEDICIVLVEIERGRIRLGIDAPEEVRIEREEVRAQRKAQEAAARAVKKV